MVYSEKQIELIGEKVAEQLDYPIESIKPFPIKTGQRIFFKDDSLISVGADDRNRIKDINFRTKKWPSNLDVTVSFDTPILFKNRHPFFIRTREQGVVGSILKHLYYNGTTNLSMFDSFSCYDYYSILNGEYGSELEAMVKSHLAFYLTAYYKKNALKAQCEERYRTSGFYCSEKTGNENEVFVSDEINGYVADLVQYIKHLKKEYKTRECEIDDIIKVWLLQRKVDNVLRQNFGELAEITGVNEKMLSLRKKQDN